MRVRVLVSGEHVAYHFEKHSRDILQIREVRENATALDDEFANDVEQDVLRPELSLQRDTIFLKVPVKKTLFDSCHEDTERSCRRERKKSSVVKPRPPPSRKSCKRHSCRVVKQCPGKRNADLVVIFQAFKHFAVIFSALPLQDVTELGVRHGQSLNLPRWEYQLRSDRSVDQG
jgi:hypothetical protein